MNFQLSEAVITAKKLLTKDIMEVILTPSDGYTGFIPGQFISIKVAQAAFRAYSICSLPSDGLNMKIVAAVGHRGLGSDFLNNITIGTPVLYLGPSGRFRLKQNCAKNIVFLCTGTGISPFIPMLDSLLNQDASSNSSVTLYFGEKTVGELFYIDILDEFVKKFANFSYKVFLSQEEVDGYGYGRITGKYSVDDAVNTQFYLCGHPAMVSENIELLKSKGVLDENIVFEKFTSAIGKPVSS